MLLSGILLEMTLVMGLAQASSTTMVALASDRAAVTVTAEGRELMSSMYSDQPEAAIKTWEAIPVEIRSDRLARYFDAKVKSGQGDRVFAKEDLADFTWFYVGADYAFVSARIDSASQVRVESMKTGGRTLAFRNARFNNGDSFVLPISGSGVEMFAKTSSGGKALWTGYGIDAGDATVKTSLPAAQTTAGCEIFVNSTPAGATVYFNGRKYHDATNTSAVRDPGSWSVRIVLDGFGEWQDTRSLTPGSSWTIDARLTAQSAPQP